MEGKINKFGPVLELGFFYARLNILIITLALDVQLSWNQGHLKGNSIFYNFAKNSDGNSLSFSFLRWMFIIWINYSICLQDALMASSQTRLNHKMQRHKLVSIVALAFYSSFVFSFFFFFFFFFFFLICFFYKIKPADRTWTLQVGRARGVRWANNPRLLMFRAQQSGLKGPPLWLVPRGRVCFIVRTPIPIKKKKKRESIAVAQKIKDKPKWPYL